MKKKLLALTVVSALAVSLAGCGGGSTAATTAAAKAPEATTAAGAAADTTAAGSDAAAAPEIVLKYAELNSDDNINTRVGYEFAKYVDVKWTYQDRGIFLLDLRR